MMAAATLDVRRSSLRRRNQYGDQKWLVTLWSLRLLLHSGQLPELCRTGSKYDLERHAQVTGVRELFAEELDPDRLTKILKERLRAAVTVGHPGYGIFTTNVDSLGSILHLRKAEKAVLSFILLAKVNGAFRYMLDELDERITLDQTCQCMAIALGARDDAVHRALRPGDILRRSGLVRVSMESDEPFSRRFMLLHGLSHAMVNRSGNVEKFFKAHFTLAPAPHRTLSDYPHIEVEASILKQYLAAALRKPQTGRNILVYGAPGVGKTELARCLVAGAGGRLYEIQATDEGGEWITDDDRLESFRLAQNILSGQKDAIVLFDEGDEALTSDGASVSVFAYGRLPRTKAWVTQLVESNAVPAIWVANEIKWLNPALIRRFDVVVRVPTPTQTVRKAILRDHLNDLGVSEQWLDVCAANRYVTPGHIERAARVVRSLGVRDGKQAETAMGRIVDSALEAAGHRPQPVPPATALSYNLDYLNPDQNLDAILDGMRRHQRGRLCLYGPPGTGKTAFAHHLGRSIGKSVTMRSASDLLSSYFGETEKNFADAFREATADGSILLLDEVDSFLAERSNTQYSWEATQVNEMLTQTEAFQGILVASTNLLDRLDQASLRRFDLKIRFDYLRTDQLWQLFNATLEKYGLKPSEAEVAEMRARMKSIVTSTPGDFAAIIRRREVVGAPGDATELLDDLVAEQLGKADRPKAGIGFLASAQ